MNEQITFIDPTAIIDQNVEIGNMTKIWHFSHISSGAKIGENCIIGQNVFIGKNVVIGNGCKIQNNTCIFEGVTLEDNVFIGPGVTFTNIKRPRAFINQKNKFLPTYVCEGASIGANSTIVCGTTINKYAFIGAGSVVTRDVFEGTVVFGNPAKEVGITNPDLSEISYFYD